MKKHFILLLFVSTLFTLTASKTPDISEKFVGFEKNLLISKYEITNLEFRIFLNELQVNQENDKYEKFYPDTAQWLDKFNYSYNEPYTYMYFWHPSYNNYPVVNISKDAINYYCTWLSKNYNSNPKRKYKEVVFRLPTEKEWKILSSPLPGHNLPWYGNFPYEENDKDCIELLANIKVKDYARDRYNYVQDGAMITVSVGAYKPNKIGIYDIIGNVAELTSDGTIKGGSWDNTLDECMIDKTQSFNLPDPRVGFRLVMELVEK